MTEYKLTITIKDKVVGSFEESREELMTNDLRIIISVLEEIKVRMITALAQNAVVVKPNQKEVQKAD